MGGNFIKKPLLSLLFLLLVSGCSSKPPSLELISAKVEILEGVEGDIVYGDVSGELVTHTTLKYQFEIKNVGKNTIGYTDDPDNLLTLKIIPNEKLLQASEEIMRGNIYEDSYRQRIQRIGGLKPNEAKEFKIEFFLGANEKNYFYKVAPPREKIEELKKNAMEGTLVVYRDNKNEEEVARFELNNG